MIFTEHQPDDAGMIGNLSLLAIEMEKLIIEMKNKIKYMRVC